MAFLELNSEVKLKKLRIIPLMSLTVMVGCSSQTSHSPVFPQNLNVIELSDGGICLDAESARNLAKFKAEYEAQ